MVASGVGHVQRTLREGLRDESLEEAQVCLERRAERRAKPGIDETTKRS